jgi:hypothetical protein
MSRTGLLFGLVALVAALAIAFFAYTNFFAGEATGPLVGPTPATERDWATTMDELATKQGIVVSFSDRDLPSWKLTDGHKLERFRISGTEQVLARLSSSIPLDQNDRLSGLRVQLPLEWVQTINGKTVEIGIVAKSSSSNGAADMSALYATLQTGNSGWQTLQLPGEFRALKFQFSIPEVPAGYTQEPVIVLRSDARGQDRGVELIGIYVRPVN